MPIASQYSYGSVVVYTVPVILIGKNLLFLSSNPPIRLNLTVPLRMWEHLKAQLQWQNCSTLNQLRDRLTEIIQQLTPELINSLAGWDFITTAILSSSS